MQRILTGIISSGVEAGVFHAPDVPATARIIMAVIGAERLPLLGGTVTVDEAEETVAGFVLRALTAA
nr:hypothetical protein GCM10020093_003570 [Planobispora longispora]